MTLEQKLQTSMNTHSSSRIWFYSIFTPDYITNI